MLVSLPGEQLGKTSTKRVSNDEKREPVVDPQLLQDRWQSLALQAAATGRHATGLKVKTKDKEEE